MPCKHEGSLGEGNLVEGREIESQYNETSGAAACRGDPEVGAGVRRRCWMYGFTTCEQHQADVIAAAGMEVELIADGFKFTEGPVWVHDEEADRDYLLFSDTQNNKIWKWEEGGGMFTLGKSLFLDGSGCRGAEEYCSKSLEPGSNGLVVVPGMGEVIICEHGNRRVTRLENNGTRTPLATHFNGRRLNSPNDSAFSKRGDLFFTDPPYGMPERQHNPDFPGFSGVYRVNREAMEKALAGEQVAPDPELVEKDFVWPNGLAFSEDFTKLYLALSDPDEPGWYVYDVSDDGGLTNRRLFLDAKPMREGGRIGAPDGLKVDERGNIFAAAPGGVAVISPDGSHLGTISSGGVFVANIVIGGDGYLYMTASHAIMRVKVLSKAAPLPGQVFSSG